MSNRIHITIEVEPDIVVVREKDGGFVKYSYLFEHGFCVAVDAEKDGSAKKYGYPKYHGTRIKDGRVQWLNPSTGWEIDEKATKEYADKEAEKALLDK